MSADDDTELRDLVIDSLEKKGVLGKIKAELRATVFLALEENEKDQGDRIGLRTGRSQQELYRFLSTEEGILTLSLVRDFLQQFDLDFSLAVLDPEASSPRKCIPRNELGSLLKLCPESDMNCPLLGILLGKNRGSRISQDQNGNNAQVTKNIVPENGVDLQGSGNEVDIKNKSLSHIKQQQLSESNLNENILSGLPGEDPFFDEPLPAARNNSLFFNFSGKPSSAKSVTGVGESQTVILSSLEAEEMKEESNGSPGGGAGDLSDGDIKKQGFGLSSLRDLPSLVNEPLKPKEGRRQWKDTDAEQRERFMNLTFGGSKLGLTDTFSSSLIDGGGDVKQSLEPDQSDPLDQEPSIEENIEEDLSALGDDLLNSNISSSKEEEDQTVDRSVSEFSKAGGYDYMENLT